MLRDRLDAPPSPPVRTHGAQTTVRSARDERRRHGLAPRMGRRRRGVRVDGRRVRDRLLLRRVPGGAAGRLRRRAGGRRPASSRSPRCSTSASAASAARRPTASARGGCCSSAPRRSGSGWWRPRRPARWPSRCVAYGLGVGIGVACAYVPMVALVGGWFVERRTLALGVAVAGIGVGTLAFPPATAALIEEIGWRDAYLVLAAVGVVTLLARRGRRRSGAAGRAPDRVPAVGGGPRRRLPPPVPRHRARLAGAVRPVRAPAVLRRGARDRPGARRGADRGDRDRQRGRAPGAGRDRGQPALLRAYQGCFAAMALSFAIWWAAGDSYAAMLVFAIVLGVGYGGFVALAPAVVAARFGVGNLGALLGVLYTGRGDRLGDRPARGRRGGRRVGLRRGHRRLAGDRPGRVRGRARRPPSLALRDLLRASSPAPVRSGDVLPRLHVVRAAAAPRQDAAHRHRARRRGGARGRGQRALGRPRRRPGQGAGAAHRASAPT